MAHFYNTVSLLRISTQTLRVAGDTIEVGVWGRDFQGRELDVVANTVGVSCERIPLRIPQNPDCQQWRIRAQNMSGLVRLEARAADGGSWDWIAIAFGAFPVTESRGTTVSPQDRAEVFAAARDGRLRNVSQQLLAVDRQGYFPISGDRRVALADAMFPVLAALARNGPLDILSLMRFGQGPHGTHSGEDAAVCSAMDIHGYRGLTIDLTTPVGATTDPDKIERTIGGVAAVIGALPQGEYAFGFTRPTDRDNGPPQPDNDVFLPKRPHEPNYKTWVGNASGQFVNPSAVDRVGGAFAANPRVRINRMFQDGRDHLHLEVISARSPGG